MAKELVPYEVIEQKIFIIRDKKVMLDKDLAELYGVLTKNLNKQVKRNVDRFPADFMFRLNRKEFNDLKFHFGTSSWGGKRKLPLAFTEQGVAMLSSVLTSKRAVRVNILIMRIFTRLREMMSRNKELSVKLKELESKVGDHDAKISQLFKAINELMNLPDMTVKNIGFLKS